MFLNCLRREPDLIIGRSDGPYLLRWYLLPRGAIEWFVVEEFGEGIFDQ